MIKYTRAILAISSRKHLRNLSDIVSRPIFRADFSCVIGFLRKLPHFLLSGWVSHRWVVPCQAEGILLWLGLEVPCDEKPILKVRNAGIFGGGQLHS